MTGSLEVTVWPETLRADARPLAARQHRRRQRPRQGARRPAPASVQKASLYGDPAFDLNELLASNGGSNGNGYRRGNGNAGNGGPNGSNGYRAKSAGTPAPAPVRPSALSIVLEETDDEDGDHERLRALLATVGDYSGEGSARLAIRQRDGEEVVMELPPVRQCPELTQLLGDIVGPWGTVGS